MGGPRPGLDPGTTGMPGTPMTTSAATNGRTTFVCSCEDTMPLDGRAIARGCATAPRQAEQLCQAQLDRFLAALAEDRPITVACTAQAPLFQQEAEAAGFTRDLGFVNIRETAGWSEDAKAAGPKMAALIAAAAVPMPATALVPMKSEGVTLVLGRDEAALAIAARLAESLDVTVLLTGAQKVAPLRAADFPVARGRARAATGWLGAFEVTVDGYAMPRPSSRSAYEWGPARDGATSRCDVLVDLTGGTPLFPTHEVRQGYLRADTSDAASVERLVARARDLVGEFDKPRFVTFDASLCAHSRNRRTACTRCLDLCPTGAITPGKDSVQISAEICAGCGACAAVCPTGAAQYAMPSSDALLRRVRTLLLTYREAGGEAPALLVHDAEHGEPLIDALARHGDGLPARVLPIRINEVSQLDLSFFLSAFAWGAAQIRVLMKGRRAHGVEGVFRNIDYATTILAGLNVPDHGAPRAAAIETDDPFTMGEALRALPRRGLPFPPATFAAIGAPREILRQAGRALAEGAERREAVIPMPALAPFGIARVDTSGCTLCVACTTVCPTGALSANPEKPQLRFLEDACVQCGLCATTCPEKVITLEPRLNLSAASAQVTVVKEEEPFCCERCAKPFGVKSQIDRVSAKLAASGHWMFKDGKQLALLRLCEDCRAFAATDGQVDPYAGPERPTTKTTEDWLREAERAKRQ
ncbi:4Fe-4S dicluster domain-containing protein [Falsiroseomonas stagni DSM 19981]|uniref:4Fe-4S dicluster domain-containing protein n=2 Tax=Falsiroseomonas TaxID=2870713 RepID=A0A1I4DF90_9PROT|nr:4Fe-4S dicluster domain-containing protein [Falsiroseomonas stagni DSM 19981]